MKLKRKDWKSSREKKKNKTLSSGHSGLVLWAVFGHSLPHKTRKWFQGKKCPAYKRNKI